jgi:hypothetical protein
LFPRAGLLPEAFIAPSLARARSPVTAESGADGAGTAAFQPPPEPAPKSICRATML